MLSSAQLDPCAENPSILDHYIISVSKSCFLATIIILQHYHPSPPEEPSAYHWCTSASPESLPHRQPGHLCLPLLLLCCSLCTSRHSRHLGLLTCSSVLVAYADTKDIVPGVRVTYYLLGIGMAIAVLKIFTKMPFFFHYKLTMGVSCL